MAKCSSRTGALTLLIFISSLFRAELHAQPLSAVEDSQSITTKLARVRQRLAREEDRLNANRKNQKELQAQIEALRNEEQEIAARKAEVGLANEQLTKEVAELSTASADVKQRFDSQRATMRSRLIALYKTQRRSASMDYLLAASSATELLKRARYLADIAAFDHRYLAKLGGLVESIVRDKAKLEEFRARLEEQSAELQQLERSIVEKRERQGSLLNEEKEKVAQQERSLEKMRKEAEGFERVLASIMGSEERVPEVAVQDEPPEVVAKLSQPPAEADRVIVAPFEGVGLAGAKGKLPMPVIGEVVQRFGKQKHEEFADIIFVKGLEIRAAVGAKVQAVAGGKVVMSQVLPGYGNVLILDHGQRYFTLYGRLATSLKSVGDVVKAGETLAVLGEVDYKNRNFYFELRVKGKATNPVEFFRDAPRMTS